jgi:hypothetical protein
MVSIINMDQLDKSLNHFHVYKSLVLGKIHELVCPIPLSISLCVCIHVHYSFKLYPSSLMNMKC